MRHRCDTGATQVRHRWDRWGGLKIRLTEAEMVDATQTELNQQLDRSQQQSPAASMKTAERVQIRWKCKEKQIDVYKTPTWMLGETKVYSQKWKEYQLKCKKVILKNNQMQATRKTGERVNNRWKSEIKVLFPGRWGDRWRWWLPSFYTHAFTTDAAPLRLGR